MNNPAEVKKITYVLEGKHMHKCLAEQGLKESRQFLQVKDLPLIYMRAVPGSIQQHVNFKTETDNDIENRYMQDKLFN